MWHTHCKIEPDEVTIENPKVLSLGNTNQIALLDNLMKPFFLILLFIITALSPLCAQTDAGMATAVACSAPSAATPVWGKLVINGNVVTCYYAKGAATPTTWTQLGSPQTVGFINNPLLVGVYITSHSATPAISSGTIDNFSISPTPTYQLTDCDIGAPTLMGSANLINGVWNLAGCGTDIWGTSDQFNFQPWLVWGNCTVICRVTSISTGNPWQKIGIMVRDGFNSGSDYASFLATYAQGIDFQYRLAFNNNPDKTLFVAPPAPGMVSSVVVGYGQTGSTSYTVRQ